MKSEMRDRPGTACSVGGREGLMVFVEETTCSCGGEDVLMVLAEGRKKSVRSLRFLVSGGMDGGDTAVCSDWDVALVSPSAFIENALLISSSVLAPCTRISTETIGFHVAVAEVQAGMSRPASCTDIKGSRLLRFVSEPTAVNRTRCNSGRLKVRCFEAVPW